MNPPDNTAVRVALWRAIHVLADAKPHVLEDEIGLALAAPPDGWRDRPDMNVQWTASFRAGIVARARLAEDLVVERAAHGVNQYVILGAGLDTFAQRRPGEASQVRIFEIDLPATQEWKRGRLAALGLGVPAWLTLVPVDFEAKASWRDALARAGFDATKPAVVVSTGVSMYLTREANAELLREVAQLATGTTLVITFMLPIDTLPADEQPGVRIAEKGAAAAGTPWVSYFAPDDMVALAKQAGFRDVRHVSPDEIVQRYFAGRADGLRPAFGEQIIVATV